NSIRIIFDEILKSSVVHKIQELLSCSSGGDWRRLTEPMKFARSIEKCLVLLKGATQGSAKLIAHQVAPYSAVGREPVVPGVSLEAVVFESRTVPLVGTALE